MRMSARLRRGRSIPQPSANSGASATYASLGLASLRITPREEDFFKIEAGAEEEDAVAVEAVVANVGAQDIERAGKQNPGQGQLRKRKESRA